jgi:membrane protein YqaA with SNARE-associated domain
MADYLLVVACIFVVNLLPAFGPPTWAMLVFFRLNSDLAAVPLVLLGALAAASGRLLLAATSRRFRSRFSRRRLESLEAAEDALVGSRGKAVAGLGLFALSPVPSAQLFVGAGLLSVPLLPLTAAFFAGRLVSYSLYVGAASAAKESLDSVLTDAFASPLGIALQILMLAGLVALVRVDWAQVLGRRQAAHSTPSAAARTSITAAPDPAPAAAASREPRANA